MLRIANIEVGAGVEEIRDAHDDLGIEYERGYEAEVL